MGFNQNGNTVIHRFPVAVPLMDRVPPNVGVVPYDPFLRNCFLERTAMGKTTVIKRPGLDLEYTYAGAVNGQGMAYYNNQLYAMGNNVLYRPQGTAVSAYSTGAAFSQVADAPWNTRKNAASVVFQNKIFVIGGDDFSGGNYFSDVWSTADGLTWTQLVSVSPWGKRSFMQVVVFNNRLYVMGGSDGTTFYNDVWVSDNGVDWNMLTDKAAWAGRTAFGLLAYNNGMFLLGGQTSGGTYTTQVYFSTDGTTWDLVTDNTGWSSRVAFGSLVFNSKMWIIGGFGGGASKNEVWSSEDGKNWTAASLGAFATGRDSLVVYEYQGSMWAVSGVNGATYYSDVYQSNSTGTAWSLVSAAPGFGGRQGATGVVFKAPSSVSTNGAPVMWIMGGLRSTLAADNDVWYSNVNGSLSTTWALSTSGATNEQFQFTTINANQYLVFKNTYSLWWLYGNQVEEVTDPNYPARTVPGIVNLNSTVYVMDEAGVIYGSALQDPTKWNSLDFLTAEYESDAGVRIAKLQNYVVALKENTTQFFNDTGAFPGISLRPISNANLRIGCASAGSVVAMDNTLVYMAQTFQAGRSIVMLSGFNPVKISNPYVDRLLNADTLSTVYAYSLKAHGHDFYVLTLVNTDKTLVYDLVEKEWHTMTSRFGVHFACNNYATDNETAFLQHESNGKIYSYAPATYTDAGDLISVQGMGDLVDFNSGQYKFCSRLQLVGDRYTTTNPVEMYWTDDNYLTLKGGIVVDLMNARPKIDRMGRFARRGHYFTHAADMPLRLEAIELTIEPGDV